MQFPDLRMGTCPATGEEFPVIIHVNGPDECYHCGALLEDT